jgi:hypothetical protein
MVHNPDQPEHSDGTQQGANDQTRGTGTGAVAETVHPAQETQPIKEKWWHKPEHVIQVAILLFVGSYTVFTFCLLLTSRDTEQRQLRAYVLVSESEVTLTDPETSRIRVQIKNYGLTPAYEGFGWNCIIVGRYSKTAKSIDVETIFPVPPDEGIGPKIIIAPQEQKDAVFVSTFCDDGITKVRRISQDEINRVKAGNAAVYMYGQFHYTDVFKQPHFLNYRLVGPGNGGTFNHPSGNGAN